MSSSKGCSTRCDAEGIWNPPGLDAVAYRTGAHRRLLSAMLARLSSPAYPALHRLRVRTADDPAIGILDAGALLGDLVTFHTERVANTGFLRTALDAESLRLLGELVGHTPRPGVAAGTWLAYTVDQATTIPSGTRAQSVPGPGEEPRSFETDLDLPARPEWNNLQVRLRRPYQVRLTADGVDRRLVHLAGTGANLKPGDRLLFVFGAERGRQALEAVQSTEVDSADDVTAVLLPGARQPTFANLSQEFAELTDKAEHGLEDDEEYTGEMYGRSRIVARYIDEVMKPLVARLEAGAEDGEPGDLPAGGPIDNPTEFVAALDEALERLDEAIILAERWPAISGWLVSPLRRDIVDLRTRVQQLEPEQEHEESGTPGGLGVIATPSATVAAVEAAAARVRLFDALGLAAGAGGPAGASTLDAPGGFGVMAANGGGNGGSNGAGQSDPALLGLAALLTALRKPPSRAPTSATELPLEPSELFAAGSDAGVRLLTALDPRVSELWRSWRNVDLTAPSPLAELQAMRTVATPFGANAPLRVSGRDSDDLPIFEEWRLPGELTVTANVEYSGDTPTEVELTVEQAGESQSTTVTISGDTFAFPWVGMWVFVSYTSPDPDAGAPRELLIRPYMPRTISRLVQFGPPDADGSVRLTVTDGGTVSRGLDRGDEVAFPHEQVQVQAVRTEEADPTDTISLTWFSQAGAVSPNTIVLDAVYEGVGPGSWVVIERPNAIPRLQKVVTRVDQARVVSQQAFGISGKATELSLVDPWLDPEFDQSLSDIRRTTVYAGGSPLEIATEPVLDDVGGEELELGGLYDGLEPGRWLIVAGERTDIPDTPGVEGAELTMVAGVSQQVDAAISGDRVHTTIRLATPLAYTYRRDTVTVHGNVVPSSAGASRDEPLGSGDASEANQRFTLFAGPLTWLPADNPRGARSTLEVRVDGVRWTEVDTLADQPPDATVYTTSAGRPDSGGGIGRAASGQSEGPPKRQVAFGDGTEGARLSTGHENVRARYRIELGESGNVAAGAISTPVDRPLGVTAVTNPLAATGGADPDTIRQIRRQIPLEVSTLDRLVGVPDYADFARTRAGIGRADAVQLVDPRSGRTVVHVTVAGAGDIHLTDDSTIVRTLRSALVKFGDPQLPVRVAVREPVLLVVAGGVHTAEGHDFELVEPRLRARLLETFGFDNRELGQPAFLSELMAAAHQVPGVDYIDVDVFAGVPGSLTPVGLHELAAGLSEPRSVVPARMAVGDVASYTVPGQPGGGYTESLTLVAVKNGITVGELLRLNPQIDTFEPLPAGRRVTVFAGIRPAQLALLSPAVPETLILKEVR